MRGSSVVVESPDRFAEIVQGDNWVLRKAKRLSGSRDISQTSQLEMAHQTSILVRSMEAFTNRFDFLRTDMGGTS